MVLLYRLNFQHKETEGSSHAARATRGVVDSPRPDDERNWGERVGIGKEKKC
jgi:hypothetical protein